jgi:hypothetical protein
LLRVGWGGRDQGRTGSGEQWQQGRQRTAGSGFRFHGSNHFYASFLFCAFRTKARRRARTCTHSWFMQVTTRDHQTGCTSRTIFSGKIVVMYIADCLGRNY